MLTQCPNCRQALSFTSEQMSRLEQALAQLPPGKQLALKCPLCRGTINLDKKETAPQASAGVSHVQPPPPPNLDWLSSGVFDTEEKVEDVPMALVLHQKNDERQQIGAALEAVGYQVFMVDTVSEAIERMRFVNFACIVFHVELEGSLEESVFHSHMCRLPMDRRRFIYYILIGRNLHTLYNLQALAYSANLTVNTAELHCLDVVLRKAIPMYEELFGPILEELSVYGKR
ncbi:MAG: hypothetical protein GXY53_10990 [Desulfobulbus sp.]|nr:hypothetical protein [Desulfobulbus sp.]